MTNSPPPATARPAPTPASGAAVTGTIAYTGAALPPDATLIVQLQDSSDCGVFGCVVVREQRLRPIAAGGTPFTLAYDPATIDPAHTYAVDARISAPGRIDWLADLPVPVLTQGHPATADLVLSPPAEVATIAGTVTYPAEAAPGATLLVLVLNVAQIGTAASPLGSFMADAVGAGPTSFTIEYDPQRLDPQAPTIIYAALGVAGGPPLLAHAPVSLSPPSAPAALALVLGPAAAPAAVSGMITMPADQALPPDAVLFLEVAAFLGDDIPTRMGYQEIAPAGSGPLPFAITIDPALPLPPNGYRISARIIGGGRTLFATDQGALAYLPVQLALEAAPPVA